MKITAIKAQVKRAGRYSVFVDEKYSFSLSDTALLDSKIIVGQELTETELKGLKQLSADDKLYGQVLGYIALRPRSVWEVESYMQRKHCPTSLQQEILNKLTELHLLDNLSFARSWVQSRRLLKPVSHRRLQLELRQKRIDDETIRAVLDDDEMSDIDALLELVVRKRKQVKYQDNNKLMQYLARQGFGYDDIKRAIAVSDDIVNI
jgi:regulatory protein